MDQARKETGMDEQDKAIESAEKIGYLHGRNAGSWVVDGNTSTEQLRRIIQESEAGEFFDLMGDLSEPLSGEWADGYTAEQLAEDVLGLEDGDEITFELKDKLADTYEQAYWSAFEAEAVRSAKAMLPDDSAYEALDQTVAYTTFEWGPGVAVRLDGPGDSDGMAYVVMVGDDRRHQVSIDGLRFAEHYCRGCGQTGCTAE
jgi:hypothetical protein